MHILFRHNFAEEQVSDLNFEALYEKRRRDSCFAFAFENDNKIFALRDHFGTVPLYYSFEGNKIRFSSSFSDLLTNKSRLDTLGYKAYISFGTGRIIPLFDNISIVPPGSVIRIDPQSKRVETVYSYSLKKIEFGNRLNTRDYIRLLDQLLLQAAKRTVSHDTVGLYLSGGIDSALTGIYLKRSGVQVNAYTCARWGKKSSELKYSRLNSENIGVRQHHMDILNSKKVKESLTKIMNVYRDPHGISASIGVASLWLNTPISRERQIYGAQGADTITCTVPIQSACYISSFLHPRLRQLIKWNVGKSLIDLYVKYRSRGLLSMGDIPETLLNKINSLHDKIGMLTIAGALVCHTPGDGECLSAPAINSNVLYSNLYYDVDLAEFLISMPIMHRVDFRHISLTNIFDKIILRKLSKKYLSPDVIYLKKGFNIPLHIYNIDMQLEEFRSPISIPPDVEAKFAAYNFSNYFKDKFFLAD